MSKEFRATTYHGLVFELVNGALSDEEVRTLCFSYFHEVYQTLAPAMSRTECIRRLVQWCYRRRKLEFLVERVRELNEPAYEEYAPALARIEERYPPDASADSKKKLPPNILHPLPPALGFVGREKELRALQQFIANGASGVIALIGLGGAGKTAITAEFLSRLLAGMPTPFNGLFVWSFYVSQDINQFLEASYLYFSKGKTLRGSGLGILYQLMELLSKDQHLLILDGLERVQRPASDASGAFGDLTDPLLAQFVARLATGLGHTKCIVTSRFPLTRLEPWRERSFISLDIDQLEQSDARLLLRRHGVKGDDDVIDSLIDDFGAHALTLDHLGGYLREFCNGDPACARELPEPQIASVEPQERKLAKVLNAYETALSAGETALLSRLCLFRSGSTPELLHEVFSTGRNSQIVGPLKGLTLADFNHMLKHLRRLHLVLESLNNRYTAHPAIRDHFLRSFINPKIFHQVVSRHFSSLVAAPGIGLPDDNETIELLEELIYHNLQAGNVSGAEEVYHVRLGGYQHLAWNLGQYSRCIRILNEFSRCPDPAGLIWCYRGVGDLDAAGAQVDPDDEWWLAMLGCLRGRFSEVAELLVNNRQDPIRVIADFLTGRAGIEALGSAPTWHGLPILPAECYLHAGQIAEAKRSVASFHQSLLDSSKKSMWQDEVARYDLTTAEILRRQGDTLQAKSTIEKATQWIVQSGSQEHLCSLHLARARLGIDEEQFELSQRILSEGLHIAEECGFGMYHIELLIEQGKLHLLAGRAQDAAKSAYAALYGVMRSTREAAPGPDEDENDLLLLGANHPKCQFIWGAARAGYLYGRSLLSLGRISEAAEQLRNIFLLQTRIKDPRIAETQALISTIN